MLSGKTYGGGAGDSISGFASTTVLTFFGHFSVHGRTDTSLADVFGFCFYVDVIVRDEATILMDFALHGVKGLGWTPRISLSGSQFETVMHMVRATLPLYCEAFCSVQLSFQPNRSISKKVETKRHM